MGGSKVLSQDAVLEAKELYEQRVKGKRVWSILKLADRFGVGETTMYRALHKASAFQAYPDPVARETSEAAASASLKAVLDNLKKEKS